MLNSPGSLFPLLAAGASFEGVLRLYPLPVNASNTTASSLESDATGGSDVLAVASFGWADAFVVPASPGSASVNSTAVAQAFRGLYRHGPQMTNDASNDPLGALGDAFICPCPVATAATAAEAAGLPAQLFTEQAGAISEAEGVYVHDAVQCKWQFGYVALLGWTVITLTPAVPPETFLSRKGALESLTAVATLPPPTGARPGLGCYTSPCNLAEEADLSSTVLLSVPANVVFEANSARMLPARRPAAGIGRFSVAYQQYSSLPASFSLRDDTSQGYLEARRRNDLPLALSTNNKSKGLASELLGRLSTALATSGRIIENPRFRRMTAVTASTDPTAGPLLLSLSTFSSIEAPCRFTRGPTSELIRCYILGPILSLIFEKLFVQGAHVIFVNLISDRSFTFDTVSTWRHLWIRVLLQQGWRALGAG